MGNKAEGESNITRGHGIPGSGDAMGVSFGEVSAYKPLRPAGFKSLTDVKAAENFRIQAAIIRGR